MKTRALVMITSFFMAACADGSMAVVEYPELDKSNPLLADWVGEFAAPPFEQIKVEHYEAAFDAAIECARAELKAIVENEAKPTFQNTIVALERQGALLDRVSGVFYPILHANTNPEIEQISMNIQPKMTELSNDISLNPVLFERVKSVYENPPRGLDEQDKMLLEECYKGFARNGAALSDSDKEIYREITTELGRLGLEFGQNILAATNAFTVNITDPAKVAELPESIREGLAAEAKTRGEKGWTVTLQAPSYIPFLTYSSQRELKEKLWRAYSTRAVGGEKDNTQIIKRQLELRLKLAQLLGYESYAAYALENRMASSTETVNSFLNQLLDATYERGQRDYNNIVEYAKGKGFEGEFMPWDFAYYSERYKDENYSLSDELVKPYLELSSVRKGVFLLAEKLYGLTFEPVEGVDVYHEDVEVYEVKDGEEHMGLLYLDFFPRESKSGGAWMTEFRNATIEVGKDGKEVEVRPLITLTMNFTKPTESTPSLLTFSEFETLLHEFGHGLHGLMAQGKYSSLNGTNVYRDFVELPSQLLENWATESEYLDLWATHYQTGEKIPAELVAKIERAANFNAGYSCVRQLQFGILDMAWHSLIEPYTGDVEAFEKASTEPTRILPYIDGAIFSPSFSHIFSGGYSAGYYSYKWAEVLEADAFELFKERGIFDEQTATSFRKNILERGGQLNPMELYVNYRGHEPSVDALIERTLKE
ncbi:MAG: M3 family metallopeptidase [Rikenellaceae bacterium]